MMFVLLGGLQVSASGFEFVQTTGRAVIMHQDAEQEARMMALEDDPMVALKNRHVEKTRSVPEPA